MANHFMNKLNLNILCISLSYDAHHIPNSGEYSRLIFNIPYFLNTIYLTKICVNYRIWLQNFHDLKIHNSTSIGCIKSSFETSIVHLTQRLARRKKIQIHHQDMSQEDQYIIQGDCMMDLLIYISWNGNSVRPRGWFVLQIE